MANELIYEDAPAYPHVVFLAKGCKATVYVEGAPKELIRDELRYVRVSSDQNLINIENTTKDNQKDFTLVGFANIPENNPNFKAMRLQLPKMVRAEALAAYPNYKPAKAAKPA